MSLQVKRFLPLILLAFAVLLRGSFLEYLELLDPTETRYASVAQQMLLLNDWLTPKLPMPDGVVPYMGKPPLHFWLTAISYSLFGVEEWTARLPSLLAAIAILFIVASFGKRFFNREIGLSAALIAFSSGILFFLAGASVTDVTLTALVSGSTYFLYLLATQGGPSLKYGLVSASLMALAFLTKGPVAIVLVWLPMLLWSALRKDFRWLKSVPWVSCFVAFLVVTAPWFIANEIQSPGSLRYFFWNENIARYLFKEYGDKYGSGHVHTYGFAWIMLIAGFIPWSLILAWVSYRIGWRRLVELVRADQNLLFTFVWGISAALFFTFVRQLHAMYILPCIPGLALFAATVFERQSKDCELRTCRLLNGKGSALTVCLLCVGIIVAGSIAELSAAALAISLVLIVGGVWLLSAFRDAHTNFATIQVTSLYSFVTYLLFITCFTPYLDETRSPSELLEDLAKSTINENEVPLVGIMTKNTFSFYWTSNDWENELSRQVKVEYLESGDVPNEVGYLAIRSKDLSKLDSDDREDFQLVKVYGMWQLYSRKQKIKT